MNNVDQISSYCESAKTRFLSENWRVESFDEPGDHTNVTVCIMGKEKFRYLDEGLKAVENLIKETNVYAALEKSMEQMKKSMDQMKMKYESQIKDLEVEVKEYLKYKQQHDMNFFMTHGRPVE